MSWWDGKIQADPPVEFQVNNCFFRRRIALENHHTTEDYAAALKVSTGYVTFIASSFPLGHRPANFNLPPFHG